LARFWRAFGISGVGVWTPLLSRYSTAAVVV